MTRWCIGNADDFGLTGGVNRGIAEAHAAGAVTSASLMVNRAASADAARLAERLPTLSVGLHVNFTNEGDPVVDLADPEACRAELGRQVQTFHRLLGRAPTHLDAHHNVHRHAHLAPVFVDAAHALGVPLREHSPVAYFGSFYAQWEDGQTHPEQVTVESLLGMVAGFRQGVTELSCHPGYVDEELDSSYARERELELATLLDPRVPEGFARLGVRLVGYRDLHALGLLDGRHAR